jgi:hypothetical protein
MFFVIVFPIKIILPNGPWYMHQEPVPQNPGGNAEQLPGGYVRWTAPSGRQYVTEPTRYPI